MFVIILTYKKSLEVIDNYLETHRAFLDNCYKKNIFVVSGTKKPRTGGIIISQMKDREQLESILSQDPFYVHDVADYEIIEFSPTKYDVNFSLFCE